MIVELVQKTDAKIILELGVRSIKKDNDSTSTHIFYETLKNLHGGDCSLYSCDMLFPKEEEYLIEDMKKSKIWHFFVGDDRDQFLSIKKMLEQKKQKIDILFIDTYKNYELTKFELENYTKLLSNDGIILMHDVGVFLGSELERRPDWMGHDRAVMEFLKTTDFKLRAQLGSYNMAVLFRDTEHLNGVEIDNDLKYNRNRQPVSQEWCTRRREDFAASWGVFEK
tara:strand:- start:2348 stop:3019 length:672 start_codon:yes stop_codon:yes gene_type:complete